MEGAKLPSTVRSPVLSCLPWAGGGGSRRTNPSMKALLIVDDEAGVRSALGGVLRDEGYQVEAVDSGETWASSGVARERRMT